MRLLELELNFFGKREGIILSKKHGRCSPFY